VGGAWIFFHHRKTWQEGRVWSKGLLETEKEKKNIRNQRHGDVFLGGAKQGLSLHLVGGYT